MKVAQSCLTLCDPMDYIYSPWDSPGQNTGVGSLSLLHGIFPPQGSSLGLPHCRRILYQLSHQGSPRTLEWVAYPISSDLPDPGLNRGLLHCRQILCQLIYQGSPEEPSVQSLSHVRLCVTPQTEAHQASPSLGFSRQEHWSGLPFPSPMHESEK